MKWHALDVFFIAMAWMLMPDDMLWLTRVASLALARMGLHIVHIQDAR
jgi:hypothetical protein